MPLMDRHVPMSQHARPLALERWTHTPAGSSLALRGWFTPPSGKPLIHFLHGNGFCARAYEPMLGRLADDFDLWLSDVQGHGDSDAGHTFVGWNASAQAAREAFDAHRARFGSVPVHAVGHSFGGVLTALMLAQAGQPFTRAVLLDPVLFPPTMLVGAHFIHTTGLGRFTRMGKAALNRRTHWPSREAARAYLRERGVYRSWTETAMQAFADHALREAADGSVELKCPPWMEASIFSSAPQRLWPAVRRIRVPTLLVHGTQTMPFVPQGAQRAAQINPLHIHLQEVEGGHCFMQEHPDHAARLVARHLLKQA